MTVIKKLINGNGNQYFPETHTKAVVDDYGNSVESVLDTQNDLINQAQMAVGAVPSDIYPTEGSTNWVTSGGVHSAVTNLAGKLVTENWKELNLHSVVTTSGKYISPSTGNWASNNNYSCKMLPVTGGSTVIITAQTSNYARYTFLTSTSTSGTPSYATGSSMQMVSAGEDSGSITVPSDATYLYITVLQNSSSIIPDKIEVYNGIVNRLDAAENEINALGMQIDSMFYDITEEIDLSSISAIANAFISPSTDGWRTLTNYSCKLVPVSSGDVIKITAQDGQYARYAFLVSNTTTANTSNFASGCSLTTIEAGGSTANITVPSDGNYLYVLINENGTNKTPKKIERITSRAVAVTAEGTSYDNTQSGLASTDVQEAIDEIAEEVIILKEEIDVASVSNLGIYYSANQAKWWEATSTYDGRMVQITPNSRLIMTLGSQSVSYFITTNNSHVAQEVPSFATGYSGLKSVVSGQAITVPSDGNYLYLQVLSGSTTLRLPTKTINIQTIKDIAGTGGSSSSLSSESRSIDVEVGGIASSRGNNPNVSYDATSENGYAFSSENGEFSVWRSVGLIKTRGVSYTMTIDVACNYQIFYYNSGRTLLSYSESTATTANASVTINTGGNIAYIRIKVTAANALPRPNITLTGAFENGSHVAKLAKQNTSNADTIITPVWIENFFSSNDSTSSLQDTGAWHIDWGVLRLPPNYDPDGKPSRLIIYCHGGTPRYNPGCGSAAQTNDFWTTTHVDPTLFLKEGYAVMDMDAVFCILNSVSNSFGINANSVLQTVNCYEAAYDYVVRNYNIMTDGVLLGGYSFGGSKSLQLILRSRIPIIASAMLCPYVGEHLFWYGKYRTVMAESAGFTNYANITDASAIDATNLAILEENYPKLLRVSPLLAACHIPSKEEFFATKAINDTSSDGFVGNCSISENPIEWGKYVVSKWPAKYNVPIKIWACTGDETAIPKNHADVLYNSAINGGSNIQLRMIQGGSHQPALGNTAITISNYVTRYGETIATVPLVYAEMVRFWRRYEQ